MNSDTVVQDAALQASIVYRSGSEAYVPKVSQFLSLDDMPYMTRVLGWSRRASLSVP